MNEKKNNEIAGALRGDAGKKWIKSRSHLTAKKTGDFLQASLIIQILEPEKAAGHSGFSWI